MFSKLKQDFKLFRKDLRGQGFIFYCGLAFIVLYYLRPQAIYSQLNIIPWLQLVIIVGFFAMIAKNQLKVTGGHVLVFVFAFLVGLSALNSLYPEVSINNIADPFIFALEVLFLSNCVKSEKQLKLLLAIFFICLFKMSLFGARTWAARGFGFAAWGIQGPPGFFQNSGEFSLLMAITSVMVIPLIVAMKSSPKLYWLLPITAVMTVMGASSRGGQLALVVGLIYLLVSYKKLKFRNVIYLCLIVTVVWVLLPDEQKARFKSAGEDDTSETRLEYWTAGIDMAKDYPWLGVGLGAFPQHYQFYYKTEHGTFLSNRREVAHNSLIQVAANTGIPALIVYLLLHSLVFERKSSNRNAGDTEKDFVEHFRHALNASIITYFVGAFFMSVAFYPYIYLLISFSIIRKRLVKNALKESDAENHVKKFKYGVVNRR